MREAEARASVCEGSGRVGEDDCRTATRCGIVKGASHHLMPFLYPSQSTRKSTSWGVLGCETWDWDLSYGKRKMEGWRSLGG